MRRFLVLALLVHLGLAWGMTRAPARVPRAEAAAIELVEVPITTVDTPIAPTEPLDPRAAGPTTNAAPRANVANALATALAGATAPHDVTVPPEVLTAAPASNGADWSIAAGRPSAVSIGLDGRNVLLSNRMVPALRSGEGPSHDAPPAPIDTTGAAVLASMSVAAHAADGAKGLGASGPVITELEGATRRSLIPVTSHGTFVVEADGNGDVINVHATGTGGDASAWTELAAEVFKSMQGRKVHVPHGWRGVRMIVALDSALALPSGSKSGAQFDGLGMRGDLSDIGATARRAIHAHVQSELPL